LKPTSRDLITDITTNMNADPHFDSPARFLALL
jgi:hypothetical protein